MRAVACGSKGIRRHRIRLRRQTKTRCGTAEASSGLGDSLDWPILMHQQGHDAQPGKERPAIYLINPHFTCRHVDIAAIAPGGALRCAASGNLLPTYIISVLRHLADVISSTDVAYVVDISLRARYIPCPLSPTMPASALSGLGQPAWRTDVLRAGCQSRRSAKRAWDTRLLPRCISAMAL